MLRTPKVQRSPVTRSALFRALLDATAANRSIAVVTDSGSTCTSCRTPLPADAQFCPRCGAATPTEISQGTGTVQRPDAERLDEAEQRRRLQRALGESFELGRLLGRGGFAEVYAATDLRLKRTVAIKVLHPDLVVSHTLIERFLREAQAVAKLRHPNIIPIYQVGEVEGLAFYIMPLIEGESLRTCLERQGALPIAEARRILHEIAEALAVAHAAGIVHRDIKPDNVMLEGNERRAIVTDFGIAKALGSGESGLTGTGMLIGTPQYMSPEQASGEKQIDARSDIYSLGCVAYQMLSGRLPFEGDTAQAMIVAHIATPPDPIQKLRPDVPDDLAAAVMRALAKRPDERWVTAGEFAAAVQAPEPLSVQTPVQWMAQRLRGSLRSSRRRIGFYAACVALLVVAAVFGRPAARGVWYYWKTKPALRSSADAGIEIARTALNETPTLFPDSGYVTLQADQAVSDASGNPIPDFTRSIYFGPTRPSNGQGGTAASVISAIRGRSGSVVVRRGELARESFAKYGYFTASEGLGICFANGDQIFGPVYSNSDISICSSGARFHDAVEVTGTITGINYAKFDGGYIQHGAAIPLPTAAAFSRLAAYASMGGMNFSAPTGGTSTQSRLRIEFLALDLDGDGRVAGPDEGFFRVYVDSGVAHADYVTGTAPGRANTSRNCGDFHTESGVTTFYSAAYHLNSANRIPGGGITHSAVHSIAATQSLQVTSSRCFLGGDDHLSVVGGRNTFVPADSLGYWVRYTATPDPAVISGLKNAASNTVDTTLAARTLEAQYLWPLSRRFNPNSKGVVYVNGRLVVSGVVRGSVTVAASDNVILADDLTYAIPPGSVPCLAADMLGLLSAESIYVADNVLNSPQPWAASGEYKIYKTTPGEFVQGVLLTLNSFTVENYDSGPTTAEPCGTIRTGRGCLDITGGLIEGIRGPVGLTDGHGYWKRYTYDQCASQAPPPHFPTTGRFFGNRNYFEIDPKGLDVAGFFRTRAPQ